MHSLTPIEDTSFNLAFVPLGSDPFLFFCLFVFVFVFVLFCFVFLPFLGPLPQHMEVPRRGVESEL